MVEKKLSIELCEGRRVRNPDTGLFLEANKIYRVKPGQFWFRRLADEDVATPKPKPTPKNKKKKKGEDEK